MAHEPGRQHPMMRVKLDEGRRERIVLNLQAMFFDEFDQELSPFQARRLVDWFAKEIGPPVYNQAIRDAHAFMQDKLEDLDGEFYEPEQG